MKVIEVYDKSDDLRCYKKNIFKVMENYLSNFPLEYSACYKHNLDSLELIKVDKLESKIMTGMYNTDENVIVFSHNSSLGHELFHMASNDIVNNKYAFESKMGLEYGLIEGMTEYLCTKAYDLKMPGSYPFEVFTVTMLEDIPNIFRPYFVPSYRDLINLFPNRKDIYGLLYSLNTYNNDMLDYLTSEYTDMDVLIDLVQIRNAIKYTLDNLISIELSIEKDSVKLNQYGDKFMDLISSDNVYNTLSRIYPRYLNYANKLVKKRIKK